MKLTTLASYHWSWLSLHPERSAEWLRAKIQDGFQVHHLDGNHDNDDPKNLVLIEGMDHARIHNLPMQMGTARQAGSKGGKARARNLSPEQLSKIGRRAAKKRWSTPKLVEITDNA